MVLASNPVLNRSQHWENYKKTQLLQKYINFHIFCKFDAFISRFSSQKEFFSFYYFFNRVVDRILNVLFRVKNATKTQDLVPESKHFKNVFYVPSSRKEQFFMLFLVFVTFFTENIKIYIFFYNFKKLCTAVELDD